MSFSDWVEELIDVIDYTECLEALGVQPTTPLTEVKRSDRSVAFKFSTATEPLILIGRLFLDLFKLIYALDDDPVPPWAQRHLVRYESGEIASLAEQIARFVGSKGASACDSD
ncbi:hypothetical protein HN588_12315 [Candidatus Bathyarchaeota archaeon]|jgi:hypothetical protein|nr:hypothetical protein [Candidatus Bathyarchaeota archaeon]